MILPISFILVVPLKLHDVSISVRDEDVMMVSPQPNKPPAKLRLTTLAITTDRKMVIVQNPWPFDGDSIFAHRCMTSRALEDGGNRFDLLGTGSDEWGLSIEQKG